MQDDAQSLGLPRSRRAISRITASCTNAVRVSPSARTASMRSNVPAGKRPAMLSKFSLGLPMRDGVADISSTDKLISPIDVTDISYISDIKFEARARCSRVLGSPSMFVSSAPYVKTSREWAALAPRRSVETAAKSYARANMVAVVMLGNDDAVSYLFDVANDRVVKTVHRQVEWAA